MESFNPPPRETEVDCGGWTTVVAVVEVIGVSLTGAAIGAVVEVIEVSVTGAAAVAVVEEDDIATSTP